MEEDGVSLRFAERKSDQCWIRHLRSLKHLSVRNSHIVLRFLQIFRRPDCHKEQTRIFGHWYLCRGRQPYRTLGYLRGFLDIPVRTAGHFRGSRGHTGLETTRLSKTVCFSLLQESDTKSIEDMHGRHTGCVTQFAKHTGAEYCIGGKRAE